MKKLLWVLLLFLLPPLHAAASTAAVNIALADADIVLRTIAEVEGLTVPREFETAFGELIETQNLGANVYRNLGWRIPLVSADAPLDLHVGFNYGKAAEWSMSIDFDHADEGRLYFAALCRGLQERTGHVSPVVRFEPMRADASVNAYYPMKDDRVLSVSSTDDDDFGRITVAPLPAASAGSFTVRVGDGDAPMYERPDAASTVLRTLHRGRFIVSVLTRQPSDPSKKPSDIWHRVRDGDGEVGWVRAADVTPVGIFDLDRAFTRFNRSE